MEESSWLVRSGGRDRFESPPPPIIREETSLTANKVSRSAAVHPDSKDIKTTMGDPVLGSIRAYYCTVYINVQYISCSKKS